MGLQIAGGGGATLEEVVEAIDVYVQAVEADLTPTSEKSMPYMAVTGEEVLFDALAASQVGTFTVNDTTNIVTFSGLTPADGLCIWLDSDSSIPTGVSANTDYFLIEVSGQTAKLSPTLGGAAVDFEDAGTGTHTATVRKIPITLPTGADGDRVAVRVTVSSEASPYVGTIFAYLVGDDFPSDLFSRLPLSTLNQRIEVIFSGGFWRLVDGANTRNSAVVLISGSTVDSSNSPTNVLRPGFVLAIAESGGLYVGFDTDGNDGSQLARAILAEEVTLDGATDVWAKVWLSGTFPAEYLCLGGGVTTQGYRQLTEQGFRFNAITGVPSYSPRRTKRKSSNYTVTAADSGCLLVATAAVTFTLPTKEAGLKYEFLQTANANLVISGGSSIITPNNNNAATLTFSTSNEKIGSRVEVECVYTAASTLKWIIKNVGGTTMVVS